MRQTKKETGKMKMVTERRSLPEEYGGKYSDEAMLNMVGSVLKSHPEWNEIRITFWEDEGNKGEVVFTFGNRPYDLTNHLVLRLHGFSLEENSFKDWISEIQREKRLISRHFPKVKVSSDLR